MKKIFCSISTNNVGCTFIDWSIHFLAGKDQYYSFEQKTWIPLVSNPLKKYNAYGHDRNHPVGLENVISTIQQATAIPNDGLYSVYPFFITSPDQIAEKINVNVTHDEKEFYNKSSKYMQDEFANIFEFCVNHADVIYIHKAEAADWNIFDSIRADNGIPPPRNIELCKFDNIWDIREHISLDMRFEDKSINVEDTTDFSKLHFRASASDLWYRGVELFQQIMMYLNLQIDPVRWKSWIPIYHEWAQKPLALTKFGDNFDDTIKCIVHGWYKELPEFTLWQEAAIQHALIYRHNLNIKTWQLEKFPNNTIELHKLLEPNTHVLVHPYEELRNAKFY